ncbi:fractalkine [Strigops habroptila]|uniref:fractalkine n=1 Tax=Strigops habroptila TaxID=2489341 RepID=UPI0011D00043|nr:fractalkine [Strigops habroptila]
MKVVSLQVLFVLRVLCLVARAGGQPKAPLKCSIECGGFTSGIAPKRIRSYRRTEPRCTKQAVIFITLKSVEICADPEAEWVKKIVEKLDQKKAEASPLSQGATSAAAPEEPGVFQKHVGLPVTAPSQATTHSEVTPEANRDSLKSPTPSATSATGIVSSQPTLFHKALVHGFDNAVGSTEEPVGHTANAMPDVQDMTSPSSNSVAIAKGSDHPGLPTNESLDPTSAKNSAPDTDSRGSDPPSILDSMETASVPTLNSTAATDKGPSVHTNKVFSSSVGAFGTTTFDYSSPVGKQEPSVMLIFTSQAFLGQARVQMTTERPNALPLPSFLSTSQMHFVILVSVVCGLMVCSVAAVWLYLKFGVKTEEMSREMVQGLLYQQERHQNNIYPMEVI